MQGQHNTNNNRVAIITGAGSGIGRAVAVALAEHCWRLALVGRTETTLQQTAATIADTGPDAPSTLVIPADLSDASQAQEVVTKILDTWDRVDALINNAATAPVAPLADTDDALLRETFELNVFAPARLIVQVLPRFKQQRRGCVVNISSMATIDPFPGLSVYAASKAALESFVRSIMNEGRDWGIESYAVAPGAVETALLRSIVSTKDLPTGQALDPADVARVVADCVLGERRSDIGRTILLPSP